MERSETVLERVGAVGKSKIIRVVERNDMLELVIR
jgi:hypothetical protein